MPMFPFLTILAVVVNLLCCFMPKQVQAAPEQAHQESDASERKLTYSKLMNEGEPGYRAICNLFASGKITWKEWVDWEYDYTTRSDDPNAGTKFDNYLYTTSEKETKFLELMSKAFAASDSPNSVFIEMMVDEPNGARLLGYSAIQSRYKEVPLFKSDDPKPERAKQIAEVVKFLEVQPKN